MEIEVGVIEIRPDCLFHFNSEACACLEEAVKLIQYDPLYLDIISKEKIRNEYKDLIINLSKENIATYEEIRTKVYSFFDKLNVLKASVSKYRVLMPVELLKLIDLDEIKIGNVRLISFSSIKTEIGKNSLPPGLDEDRIWAEVLISAEYTEAISKGQREIERVINLLRIYIPKLFNMALNKKIGLDKYENKRRYYLIIDSIGNIGGGGSNLGPLGNYELNKTMLEDLKKDYCLDEISGILSKTPSLRSDLEKSIIMAIRWLGLGVANEVLSDRFLSFAIALECLLIKRGEKGDKAEPISKRAAFILGTTPKECDEIVNEMKLLYDIRSAIVHQGCEAEEEEIIKDTVPKIYD